MNNLIGRIYLLQRDDGLFEWRTLHDGKCFAGKTFESAYDAITFLRDHDLSGKYAVKKSEWILDEKDKAVTRIRPTRTTYLTEEVKERIVEYVKKRKGEWFAVGEILKHVGFPATIQGRSAVRRVLRSIPNLEAKGNRRSRRYRYNG